MKTLGLDLGTNSLGWAVINETAVETAGVLVFEEGILREKGIDSLKTPAALRREARMARRLRFRRHLRRRLILKILIDQKMCPLTQEELKTWSQTGSFPKDNTAFVEWLKSTDTRNPYCDRARAAAEKVDPFTLGRAIYHLAQRRGFKSGRKDQPAEDEETNTSKAEELGEIKGNIARISAELEKSGLTLGQYFYEEIKRGHKVRKQHTGRVEHYEKEWARIAAVQELDKMLAKKIATTLFWQRPLREQSFLVGKCPLEPKRNRAQIGHPEFEEFRALSFVNNIRVLDGETRTPLTAEQRAVATDCFTRKSPFEFKDLAKKLRKQFKALTDTRFNYDDDNPSLSPSKVTADLKGILPDSADLQKAFDALTFFDDTEKLKTWAKNKIGLSEEDSARFVNIRIPEGRAGYSLHAIRKINRFLRKGVELSEAIFLAKIPDVISDFDAREDDIITKVHEHNDLYRENKRTAYHDTRIENRVGVLSLQNRLSSWLEEDYGIDAKIFGTLYFRDPKADSSYADVRTGGTVLPPVNLGMIRNPLVQRSMTMLRKLVNELHRKGTIDAETRIHIELARDVNSRNDRMAIQEWQKENEKERADAQAKLQEHGIAKPAEDLILKYVLWAEQPEHCCLYCGKSLGVDDLVNGSDIEHTLPRSRSGDDSQANKTVACVNCNRNIKKGLMPSELPNHEAILLRLRPWEKRIWDLKALKEKQAKIAKGISKENPEARAKARQKMLATKLELKYWEDKYHRFTKKPDDVTPSFMNRQLIDTGIMTRHAVALLKAVYSDVYPVNGQAVAFARKLWKVQGEDEIKDRSDHTHHAKDALVIAALSRDRFQKICAELKADDERKNPKFNVAPPFAGFAQAVYDATAAIPVKHVTRHNEFKQTHYTSKRLSGLTKAKDGNRITSKPAAGNTVRGQLHKDSFYGRIRKPGETEIVCVIRKELTHENFDKAARFKGIVDKAIRARILDTMKERGGIVATDKRDANGEIIWESTADFKKAIDVAGFTMASGVPIRKVRVQDRIQNPLPLRKHEATPSRFEYKNPYYVAPAENSNFCLSVYQIDNETPHFIVENLLKFVQGGIRPAPEGACRVGRILPGAMAIAYQRPGEWSESDFPFEKRLYKVENFSDSDGRMILRFHKEARRMTDIDEAKQSRVDFERPHALLRLSFKKAWATFRFEGVHFAMGLDGTVTFIDRETDA
jgi:CRISPR-associated endonuclease Csn1